MERDYSRESVFDEYAMDKALRILLILFTVRFLFGLVIGLVSEVSHSNGYDELIAKIDYINPLLSNSLYNYQAPSWLADFSLIEIFEFGCYMYCIVMAIGCDIFSSSKPIITPIIICVEFLLFHAYHFSEILGAHLIWLILFGLILVVLVGYAIMHPMIALIAYLTGAGAWLSTVITTVLLPIICSVVVVSSFIDFFS